jgi:hypothetical protein
MLGRRRGAKDIRTAKVALHDGWPDGSQPR